MTWQYAKRNSKVFVYRSGAMTPSFTFEKRTEKGHFIGHGLYFMSVDEIKRHIDRNGDAMLKKSSAQLLVANRTQ